MLSGYIITADSRASVVRQNLEQAGYETDWIAEHLIAYPDEWHPSKANRKIVQSRRVMALASRTIRPKAEATMILPLRVKNELPRGESAADQSWIGNRAKRYVVDQNETEMATGYKQLIAIK